MTSQITRLSPSANTPSIEAGNESATPGRLRSRSLVEQGEPASMFSRTDNPSSRPPAYLLEEVGRMLAGNLTAPGNIARQCAQLANAAMTQSNSQWLLDDKSLQPTLHRCEERVKQTPREHPAHGQLRDAIHDLKTARQAQTIAQLNARSSATSCLCDLFALLHMDPKVLAEPREGSSSYMLFDGFLRRAHHRIAELSTALQRRAEETTRLLKPHADSLQALAELPSALHASLEQCPDPDVRANLMSLREASSKLIERLRHTGALPSEEAVTESDAEPAEARSRYFSKRASREAVTQFGKKTDIYEALASKDDAALLTLLRRPAPRLTPEQMHTFLNQRVIELDEDQLQIVSDTPLPANRDGDPEAARLSDFDEKLRQALANGSLVLTAEQRERLESTPKADAITSDPLKSLLDKPSSAWTEVERGFLNSVTEANGAGQIDAWLAHNARLPEVLQTSGLPAQVQDELLGLNEALDTELATLKNGASLTSRMAVSPALLALSAGMPLAVAFVSGDKPYASSLIAHYVKTGALAMGLMNNPLTNRRTNLEHFLNRHAVTLIANGIVAVPTFQKNEHLLEQIGFAIAAAVGAGGLTIAIFNRDSIWSAIKTAKNKLSNRGTGEANIGEENHQAMLQHVSTSEQIARQTKLVLDIHKRVSEGVTDTMNSSATYLLTKVAESRDRFAKADAERMGQVVETTPRKHDPDLYPKMGLVAVTAAIGSVLVALLESLGGKADYAADTAWCVSEMAKVAANPEADMQKALQVFKEIVGLNLIFAAFLGVDKFTGMFSKGVGGFVASALALTLANAVFPGMVGSAAGNLTGKGLSFAVDKSKSAYQATRRAVGRSEAPTNPTRLASNVNALQASRSRSASNLSAQHAIDAAQGDTSPSASVDAIELQPRGTSPT